MFTYLAQGQKRYEKDLRVSRVGRRRTEKKIVLVVIAGFVYLTENRVFPVSFIAAAAIWKILLFSLRIWAAAQL